MPYKVCAGCGKECGVRTRVCSCGAPFHSDVKSAEKPQPTTKKEKPVSTKIVNKSKSRSIRKTFVAAGDCPVKPKGFVGGKWVTQPTDDDIREWAVACYNSAPEGEEYLPHAIEYWAHEFWGWQFNEEFNRVVRLVYLALLDARGIQADDDLDSE